MNKQNGYSKKNLPWKFKKIIIALIRVQQHKTTPMKKLQ